MGKKVTCTCPVCIEHRVTINGQEIPGRRVTPQQRRVHEIAAVANRVPEYAKARTSQARKSHPVGVEELFDEEEDGKNKPRNSSDVVIDGTLIIQLCSSLLVWLNLKAGVSHETANTILKALQFIITAALELLQAALAAQGIPVQIPKLQIPSDIRTIY
ncbi:hypothetical protein FB451DRAFT_1563831 [Mycena latifolia]|nr:hypothetical protein FB451DRAFT_1563831 [Mycena latifolia]